jgi:hypothetical protein
VAELLRTYVEDVHGLRPKAPLDAAAVFVP